MDPLNFRVLLIIQVLYPKLATFRLREAPPPLQSLPADQVPACGPNLDYMLDAFPLTDVLTQVLSGSGECAEISWRFLGLTIPGWSLVVFGGVLVVALVQLLRPRQG